MAAPFKILYVRRYTCVLAIVVLFPHYPASAAERVSLTERQAVELALARPALQELEQGHALVAESNVLEAKALPNPVFALERESVSLPNGSGTELSARISQSFDTSGRRFWRKEAAISRMQAVRFDANHRRLQIVADVRSAFGEALYLGLVRQAYAEWLGQIEAAAGIVAKLARAGEVSGYDRRRVEREANAVRTRVSGASADEARAREMLGGLVGKSASEIGALDGELVPAEPGHLSSLRTELSGRPDFVSMQARAQAFDHEVRANERGWIPDLTVGVGTKRVEEQGVSDTGFIVGFSFPIPLFERGQPGRQRALAQASTLRAESKLLHARAEAELRGVWRQAEELRTAAAEFRERSVGGSRDLSRIAEAAYRGGEVGVLELLDAYEAEFDAQATWLELALRARRARIELDVIAGREGHD